MTISFDRVADIYDDTRALPSEISNRITDTIVRLSNAAADTHFFEPELVQDASLFLYYSEDTPIPGSIFLTR